MSTIHPTALVAPGARLAAGVVVGPFCVVGDEVTLEAGVHLLSHVVVDGPTLLGEGVVVHPFAAIGGPPQDLKYQGERSDLVVGPRTLIREHVTVHRGTAGGGGTTRVGEGCLLMAGVHVAHDCQLGDGVVMANQAALGGHVEVGDGAVLGAFVGVHQFARVGELAMVAAGSRVSLDAPPFCLVQGDRARLVGINVLGLRRAGWGDGRIRALRRAARAALSPGEGAEAPPRTVAAEEEGALRDRLQSFVATSRRGVLRFR